MSGYKLRILKYLGYAIDLGSHSFTGGGFGTPEEIAQNGFSLTGKAIKDVLKQSILAFVNIQGGVAGFNLRAFFGSDGSGQEWATNINQRER